jgi:hypothetical protein
MHVSIKARVARGARLLDQVRPGWADMIDMEVFDIEDLRYCILGQLFGGWADGCTRLGLRGDRYKQELNGFEMTESEYHSEDVGAIRADFWQKWDKEVQERSS